MALHISLSLSLLLLKGDRSIRFFSRPVGRPCSYGGSKASPPRGAPEGKERGFTATTLDLSRPDIAPLHLFMLNICGNCHGWETTFCYFRPIILAPDTNTRRRISRPAPETRMFLVSQYSERRVHPKHLRRSSFYTITTSLF